MRSCLKTTKTPNTPGHAIKHLCSTVLSGYTEDEPGWANGTGEESAGASPYWLPLSSPAELSHLQKKESDFYLCFSGILSLQCLPSSCWVNFNLLSLQLITGTWCSYIRMRALPSSEVMRKTEAASHLLPTTFCRLSRSPRRHKHSELFKVQTTAWLCSRKLLSDWSHTRAQQLPPTEISQGRRQTFGVQLLEVQVQPGPCEKVLNNGLNLTRFSYYSCLLLLLLFCWN